MERWGSSSTTSVQNYNLNCIYTRVSKHTSGLILDGQVARQRFWREECRPYQPRSTRNLPRSEWRRSQSLCRQCSAKQAHMLYQNPLKIAREKISHQISRKVRMEGKKDGTKSSIIQTQQQAIKHITPSYPIITIQSAKCKFLCMLTWAKELYRAGWILQ